MLPAALPDFESEIFCSINILFAKSNVVASNIKEQKSVTADLKALN